VDGAEMKCRKCGYEKPLTRLFRKDGTRRTKIIGRPRKTNHSEAIRLRNTGLSLSQVAKKLGVSKGSIEYATRKVK
jgi:hypothetical protein